VKVRLRLEDERGLPGTVAHEGSHLADTKDLNAATVVEDDHGGARLQNTMGSPSDLTKYETEKKAYQVSGSIAEGQYAINHAKQRQGATVVFSTAQKVDDSRLEMKGHPNVVIWDQGWKEQDRVKNRDEAIDRYLAQPPLGLYGVGPQPAKQGTRLSGAPAVPNEEPQK
jgi:hypothetical protein